MIEIVSIPPGARIEVNGTFVGRAPLWHVWRDADLRSDPRRSRGLTIAAFPAGHGQRTVVRGIPAVPARGRDRNVTLPERVVLDLGMETPPARRPAEPLPESAEPKPEPEVEAFLWPWARETHRAARDVLRRELERCVGLATLARERAERMRHWVASLVPVEGSPPVEEMASPGSDAPAAGDDALEDLLLTGLPGMILLGSVALLALLGAVSVIRFVVGVLSSWIDWEPRFERGEDPAGGADVRRRVALYCAALGLPADAPFDDVRRRYRELAIRYHPDKDPSHAGAEQFKRVSHAYMALERIRREEASGTKFRRQRTG